MEILIAFCAFGVAAFVTLFSYRLGIRDGQRIKEDKPVEVMPKKKEKAPELTDAQKELNERLKFINDFEVKL